MGSRIFKKFTLLIISLCLLLSCGCKEDDGSGYLFKYSLLGTPQNLDPQLADDASSLTVIQNMFDGLLRISEDGKLTEGVATDYTVSSDGLKYIFNLRDDVFWAGTDKNYKEPVTADDFVFAFRRIFDSRTSSPYMSQFACLKNAEKIISGELEFTSIGVSAPDKHTVEFILDYPNADFLTLLTTSPSMPCNERFFYETKGKYGLEPEAVISNGPFYLKQWEYDSYSADNYLILRRNNYFSAIDMVYPSGLNFFVETENSKIQSDFFDGATDCFVSDGSDKRIFKSQYTAAEYETSSYGFIFNLQDDITTNINIREGLSLSIDRDELDKSVGDSARAAYGLVPSGVTMLNKSYRELISEYGKTEYDLNKASEKFKLGLSELGMVSLEGFKILIPESYANVDYLKVITQQWQKNLNFYCGIETVTDNEYYLRLKNGDYRIALLHLTGEYNSPYSVLEKFSDKNYMNYSFYSNQNFNEVLQKTKHSKNLSDSVKLYEKAENIILADFAYIPVYYQKEYLVYHTDVKDIQYNPFTKQIYFKAAKKFS